MTTSAPHATTPGLHGPAHPPPPAHPAHRNGHPHPLLAPVIAQVLEGDREYRHYAHPPLAADPTALQDFVLAADGDDVDPEHVSDRLRWGGQFVFASRS